MVIDIVTGKSINLLTADVIQIAHTSDEVYGYPPYVGMLEPKFKAVFDAMRTNVVGKHVYTEGTGSDICIHGLYRYLKMTASSYETVQKRIDGLETSLTDYKGDVTVGMKYIVEDVLSVIRDTTVDQLHFTGDNCLASAVLELLKFLK
jgi:hypothetical protein